MYTGFVVGIWSLFLKGLSQLFISFDGVTISFLYILIATVFFDVLIEFFDMVIG